MSNKKTKKIVSSVLASALILSNLSFVTSAQANTSNTLDSKIKQFKQLQSKDTVKIKDSKEKFKAKLNPEDNVRVIVEVEGQTPLEHATKKGLLFKELDKGTVESLTTKLKKQQKNVKEKIKSKGVKLDEKLSFSTAFNGFSGEMKFGDLEKVEAIAGVKNVYLANEYNRPEEEPEMTTSHQFIQSRDTWADSHLKGEGMVVAVIDSGVDPSHKDFVLTDAEQAELDENEVNTLVKEEGLKGKFYTDKVPYGYNYYDQNDTILDLGPDASMHGMHVAGTVAANGDEANGGIKGVAPEAQVLGMKVFSNDPNYPSTWSDVYLAAIDESVSLGADVLNMSLGSTASFYDERSPEDLAITRANENGIVSAVSAGNSGHIADGWGNPYYNNPDIGVVGAPGLNTDTIQVAASGNEAYLYAHSVSLEGANLTEVGYGIDDWTKIPEESLELVSIGGKVGNPEDFEGVDVKGKIVLVQRGVLSFFDKTQNAAAAGAAGIIVYNNVSEDKNPMYKNQGGWDVPFMMITKAQGEGLEAAIANGDKTFDIGQESKEQDPEMGRMTDFTSWGTTPSLELKPEITAPGGKIYSTLNDDQYGVMSGTSMASPHVAGGSALVQQYLQSDDRFADLSADERTDLAKVLLMNTADVIEDLSGQPFSPRRQGAGMMQTHSAVDTPVYVVNKSTGEAKVELKDFTETKFNMTFTATNISEEDYTYNVDASVLTDTFEQAEGSEDLNALIAGDLEGAKIDAPETVTVKAGESVDFTVSVDFSDAKLPGKDKDGNKTTYDLKEDIFVEGFVTLTKPENKVNQVNLTVPYVGFYGEWDRPSILDGFADLGESKFYEHGLNEMLQDEDGYLVAPVPEKDFYPVSPNGDGAYDDIYPLPSFMRNASEVQYNILDKDGKFLRRVLIENDVRKNFFDAGSGSYYSFNPARSWNGKVKSETVEDGLYYYEIKSVIDYEGAEWQSKKIPVYVDTTAPKLESTYDEENKVVTWETKEEGTGVAGYAVFVNGEAVSDFLSPDTNAFNLTDVPEKAVIEVAAVDYAENYGFDKAAVGDVDIPLIFVGESTPEPFGAYKELTVPVEGYVTDDLGLDKLTVNGEEVEFTLDSNTGRYNFSTEASFEKDGKYDVIITATDVSGKEFSIARKVFIDTTAPEIEVEAPEMVEYDTEEVTLSLQLKDNYNYLSLYVDDNHELEQPFKSPVSIMEPANKSHEITLPVKHGDNTFSLRLVDLGGNETVQEVKINRSETEPVVLDGWVEEGGHWFFYKEDVKQTGFLVDGGKTYYLNSDGVMQTGWVEVDGKWYFFNSSGAAQAGWVKDAGKWYYMNKDYKMATGWVKDAGKWYFLSSSGAMKTGWVKDKNTWYYLNASGVMQTGWVKVSNKWYYMNSSGAMQTGWVKIDNKWYKFDKNGVWIS
ncbi:hypothetical protein A6P54_12630 [Bacillus sp. MKU004]|nr:hypothetical protein A6P54_12630 [Bacillus sp. MKU004]